MADAEGIRVEVAYAEPERQWLRALTVAPGTTVGQAIEASGVLAAFPVIDLARNRVGIFGALARLEDRVAEGDRVEIYRPLVADPKEARRRRAAARTSPKR